MRGQLAAACCVLIAVVLSAAVQARQLSVFDRTDGVDVLKAAGSGSGARQLHSQGFCPDGCAPGFCAQDATGGGLRCLQCLNNLLVNQAVGVCGE